MSLLEEMELSGSVEGGEPLKAVAVHCHSLQMCEVHSEGGLVSYELND